MGRNRKGRKARVSHDADADGSEDERATTAGRSLYEVRCP
jgi:DnaJ homolog subfamily C member 9